jgi:molybdenum cofactor cytidylyltransferase
MGTSKLLLPWNGATVIEQLLSLLLKADLATVSVSVRADDVALQGVLTLFRRRLAPNHSIRLNFVSADPAPREMRDSVELLLDQLQACESPSAGDAWMLIPADAVAVQPATIDRLIEHSRSDPRGVLIPSYAGRRGHPTVFGWELAKELAAIPPEHGINWLLHQAGVSIREVEVDDRGILCDLDTPQDYEAWRPNHD